MAIFNSYVSLPEGNKHVPTKMADFSKAGNQNLEPSHCFSYRNSSVVIPAKKHGFALTKMVFPMKFGHELVMVPTKFPVWTDSESVVFGIFWNQKLRLAIHCLGRYWRPKRILNISICLESYPQQLGQRRSNSSRLVQKVSTPAEIYKAASWYHAMP